MKKYQVQNYVRWKHDIGAVLKRLPDLPYEEYSRDELCIKFLPLVETMARKFSTSDQASGVLSIMDLIQEGARSVTKAVDRIEWSMIENSEDKEKTLKILDQILKGESAKPGSYRGRANSEPENNRKTLLDVKNA